MRHGLVSLLASFIAVAFVLPVIPEGTFEKVVGMNSESDNEPAADSDELEDNNDPAGALDVDDENVEGTLLAGGGGWFMITMSGTMYKDTFGSFIDGDIGDWSSSAFVFHARDQDAVIHSVNFTNIEFETKAIADLTFVHAWGWATYNKEEGFWFHLVLKNDGMRTNDLFELALYKDINKNWVMDDASPMLSWIADGLGGGNIWIAA